LDDLSARARRELDHAVEQVSCLKCLFGRFMIDLFCSHPYFFFILLFLSFIQNK
jgi:hypothetical protein